MQEAWAESRLAAGTGDLGNRQQTSGEGIGHNPTVCVDASCLLQAMVNYGWLVRGAVTSQELSALIRYSAPWSCPVDCGSDSRG